MYKNNKRGFTLAEILITLGIIGVVAVLTIPSLINSTRGTEFKAGFKTIFAVLCRAISVNFALNKEDFSMFSATATNNTNSVYYVLNSRLQVASAGVNSSMGGPFNNASNYTLFLNDGMAITWPQLATNCDSSSKANCKMVVDVNGTHLPNALSTATDYTSRDGIRDQFVLDFFNQQILPHDTKAKFIMDNY